MLPCSLPSETDYIQIVFKGLNEFLINYMVYQVIIKLVTISHIVLILALNIIDITINGLWSQLFFFISQNIICLVYYFHSIYHTIIFLSLFCALN